MPRLKQPNANVLIRMYLYKYREKKGLSQLKVAKLVGWDHCTYNQIENGKLGNLMNAKKLKGLADAFDVDVSEIIDKEIEYLNEYERLNPKQERW